MVYIMLVMLVKCDKFTMCETIYVCLIGEGFCLVNLKMDLCP